MDVFGNILTEIAHQLNTTLHPDNKNSCTVVWEDKVTFQLELDRMQEYLIAGMTLGEVGPGAYREAIFKEALKHNNNGKPPFFALSTKLNQLVLFLKYPVKEFSAEKVIPFIQKLVEVGNQWQDSLSRGNLPTPTPQTPPPASGMFDMKP